MKKFTKSVVSVALIGSMLFSLAGCSKVKFEAIKAKDFKKALETVYEVDEDDDDFYEFDYDDYEIVEYEHKNVYISYMALGDEDDALEVFDDMYDEFEDMLDDDAFKGKTKLANNDDESGYILFNGECTDDDYMEEGDAFGGVYFIDDIIIMVMVEDADKDDIKEAKAFLDEIGYSHL